MPIHSFPEEDSPSQLKIKVKRLRKKVSWGWKEVEMVDNIYKCKLCELQFPKLGTTQCSISNVKAHIKKHHRALFETYAAEKIEPVDLNYKFLEWVLRRNHPYSIVEQSELISVLNFTPGSRGTLVEKFSKRIYKDYKAQV